MRFVAHRSVIENEKVVLPITFDFSQNLFSYAYAMRDQSYRARSLQNDLLFKHIEYLANFYLMSWLILTSVD
jgi:hypothetical protein